MDESVDCFSSKGHSKLGQLLRQQQIHSLLDIIWGEGTALPDEHSLAGFRSDAFEDVIDQDVHDVHRMR